MTNAITADNLEEKCQIYISPETNKWNKLALEYVTKERAQIFQERTERIDSMRGKSLPFIKRELGEVDFREYFESRDVKEFLDPVYRIQYGLVYFF